MKNTIFFAVDCQKDFLSPTGVLYVRDSMYIRDKLQLLTQIAEEENIKVINTADFHTDQSKEISEKPDFVNTFPRHCMIYDDGSDFIEEINPKTFDDNYYIVNYTDSVIDEAKFYRARNIIIFKDAFDVFASNKLTEEVLIKLQKKQIIKNVVVYGVVTSICVKFAIDGLLKHKFKVFLVIDAIKDLPEYPTEDLYAKWINLGVILTTTEKIGE